MIDLLVDKELTPEAQSPHTAESPRARRPLGETDTGPPITETPVGVTALFFQDVVNRYATVKSFVTLKSAQEHVATLILIADGLYFHSI
jgi:hypothetical protein